MSRPRLLDLFCCAGGAGTGYHRAGFAPYGVDIDPQPRYPFAFHHGDAMAVMAALLAGERVAFTRPDGSIEMLGLADFDAVHASPPCQKYSPLAALSPEKAYPDLIDPTRASLDAAGVPYIIENVMSAPLEKGRSVTLCGGMFGLRTYRHRRFESRLGLVAPAHPKHVILTATKQRKARWAAGWHVSITGDVGTYVGPEAMGIDWMSGNELCEAIPPAYTEYLGRQLMAHLVAKREAA
jgi:DNA (cytosine-5)-methyltransferase 1